MCASDQVLYIFIIIVIIPSLFRVFVAAGYVCCTSDTDYCWTAIHLAIFKWNPIQCSGPVQRFNMEPNEQPIGK